LLLVSNISTAKAVWEALELKYHSKGITGSFLLMKELFKTKLTEFPSMEDYLAKVKNLVDNLANNEV
jgi:hypothetical protein